MRYGFVKSLLVLMALLIPSLLTAGEAASVCHTELSSWIRAGQPLVIVDIQDADGFRSHNYAHSIAVGNDQFRLKKIAARLRSAEGKVVVVSTTGGADAVQAAEQLVRRGVPRSRVLVLEGGMQAAVKKVACDCCKPVAKGADK
jgi:rhodanese-related sulfurtransferase